MPIPNVPFVPFQKMPRFSREVVITEKIDGTNGVIYIPEGDDTWNIYAGSRTQWITPEKDNFGFAKWVESNRHLLLALGPGTHYGEWWGAGIQRGYGEPTKRFSLFNTARWADASSRPVCCDVVPVMWEGPMDELHIFLPMCLDSLRDGGSRAAPGYGKPEGLVIYHSASRTRFKKTLERDAEPKSFSVVGA